MILFLMLASVQGLAIFVDEVFFHYKRKMPKWERIGHPLDTLTILICFLFLILVPKNIETIWIYTVLATLSTLFVTKDEWVHHEYCTASEMWLHSILFILHPLVFISSFAIWGEETFILKVFTSILFIFMIYQTFYWNFYENRTLKI